VTAEPIYTATSAELELASAWHGGQSSMLYAVASTGALSRGTIRAGRSDAEWSHDLVLQLQHELSETLEGMEREGFTFDAGTVREWLRKLEPIAYTLERACELEADAAELEQ